MHERLDMDEERDLMIYDVDLQSSSEDDTSGRDARGKSYKSRSRRPGPGGGFTFGWKFLVAVLALICGWLLFYTHEMKKELSVLREATGLSSTSQGSFIFGEAVADSGGDPTEEDSIRAWEADQEEHPDSAEDLLGIRKVYLTFDDGPSRNTEKILDILDEYDVKATFFVVGAGKETFSDTYREILDRGHTLGMHSFTHVYKDIYSSRESFIEDLNLIMDYIHEKTGTYPEYFRFPGGSSTGLGNAKMSELTSYLDEIGIEWFDWNISSGDATGRLNADQIYKNTTSRIEEYSDAFVLFHDSADKASTVEALPKIIETILAMEDTVIVPITSGTVPLHH